MIRQLDKWAYVIVLTSTIECHCQIKAIIIDKYLHLIECNQRKNKETFV